MSEKLSPFYLTDQLTFMRELHGHNTRNKYLLQIPHSHTNVLKQSFSYGAAILWNSLPEECYSAKSVNIFKQLLNKYLLS